MNHTGRENERHEKVITKRLAIGRKNKTFDRQLDFIIPYLI